MLPFFMDLNSQTDSDQVRLVKIRIDKSITLLLARDIDQMFT